VIDITTSQIKSVAPFAPVINDLNFGLVGPGPQPGQCAPICPSKREITNLRVRASIRHRNSISHMLHNNNMGGVLLNLK
jgi:hypothetical protein